VGAWLSMPAAAARLGVSRDTLRRWLKDAQRHAAAAAGAAGAWTIIVGGKQVVARQTGTPQGFIWIFELPDADQPAAPAAAPGPGPGPAPSAALPQLVDVLRMHNNLLRHQLAARTREVWELRGLL
jgi:hypothetical protein